jgi:cardiolipin synthase
MLKTLEFYMPYVVSLLWTITATLTTFHIVLYKRETRSAIGWMGLSWLTPILGSILYLIFGINRIERKAESLREGLDEYDAPTHTAPIPREELDTHLEERGSHLGGLARLVGDVVDEALLPGNAIEPLINGDEAYPAMLEAIDEAETSVTLTTYIFDNDAWGERFVEALGEAARRGVEVRVLIDAAGLRYSFPSVLRKLQHSNVETARFLPSFFPPHLLSINMRNHRKVMVVDGELGFTGGMNIRAAHVVEESSGHAAQDLHFRVEGPVVTQLQEIFVDDWRFSTGEKLRGETWFPDLESAGDTLARGIPAGPDEHIEKLSWTLHGALACAQESVRIVTPYFLPDESLTAALNTAALRGVDVDVILPKKSNLPFVHWATFGQLRPLLERGCRVWLTPPPFDHSKLMVVDEQWTLMGSANWDPRSLRLNFEFNVECYDTELAERMDAFACEKRDRAERVTLESYDSRSLPVVLRDNLFRLGAPYM